MNKQYYEKYFKYKLKYLKLKKQLGGDDINQLIQGLDNTTINLKRLKKIKETYSISENIFENNQIAIIETKKDVIDNTNNIDKNIIVYNKIVVSDNEYTSKLYTKTIFNYLTCVLKQYNNINLFLSFAPVNLKEYYFPLFLREYLTLNQDEQIVIMIFGHDYEQLGYKLTISDIDKYLKEIKNEFGDRVKFIHVYTYYNLDMFEKSDSFAHLDCTDIFKNFLINNKRICKLNILYIGFQACGYIYNLDFDDYINIGCNGYKYKDKIINFDSIPIPDLPPDFHKAEIPDKLIKMYELSGDPIPDRYKVPCNQLHSNNGLVHIPEKCKITWANILSILKE